MRRTLLAFLLPLLLVAPSHGWSQGLLLARLACATVFQGVNVQGMVELQLFGTGTGLSAQEISRIAALIFQGRGHEVPGSVYMIGFFQGGGSTAQIEAPNMVGGRGTGAIAVNGQMHRPTYAQFAFVQGGFVARTEDGATISFACRPV